MFNFSDRESYISWVKNWKAEYKDISKLIRDTKTEIKKLQKEGSSSASTLQYRREHYRSTARQMLVDRADAKVEAQRQYVAAQASIAA